MVTTGPSSVGKIPGIPITIPEVIIIPPINPKKIIPFVFYFTEKKSKCLVISYSNKRINIITVISNRQ